MTEASRRFPGSRWWQCDLHVHTTHSHDWPDQNVTAADWVTAALSAGLNMVAVADHVTAAGVDDIKHAAAGTPLVVLPGVEVTVHGGIHLLAVFDNTANADTVKAFLGACGLKAHEFGLPTTCTTLSFVEVAAKVTEFGGICLAAHADSTSGLVSVLTTANPDGTFTGHTSLAQCVLSPHLAGAEVRANSVPLLAFLDNSRPAYKRSEGPLALFEGSDAHATAAIGQRRTWVKMSTPNLAGLRLALGDSELAVARATNLTGDPNAHAEVVIESFAVEEAKYFGRARGGNPRPFVLDFNPWLNCIIGGRGTGKSSILEFLRLACDRRSELDTLPERLRRDFDKYEMAYKTRHDDGLLTEQATMRVTFRKNDRLFRIGWAIGKAARTIEEQQLDGSWRPVEGEVRTRFPVRLFSQKQIFELAGQPNALLGIIDDNEAVGTAEVRADIQAQHATYLSLRAKARELGSQATAEVRLRGERDDVNAKMQLVESPTYKGVIESFETGQHQDRQLQTIAGRVALLDKGIEVLLGVTVGEDAVKVFADAQAGSATATAREVLLEVGQTLLSVEASLTDARTKLDGAAKRLVTFRESGVWREYLAELQASFDGITAQTGNAALGTDYTALAARRSKIDSQLEDIESKKQEAANVEAKASLALRNARQARKSLTDRRTAFLQTALSGNEYVSISVTPYGDYADAERGLRDAIGRQDQTFQDQIWSDEDGKGVLWAVYNAFPPADDETAFVQAWEAMKARLLNAAQGTGDCPDLHGKFVAHLRKLPPEALDRIMLLMPEDSVRVSYRPRVGEEFTPIEQGSPGQKSAAILAFLLSHGSEPLVLDQPEDDLDNRLISDLVVNQLRQNKSRRQTIIVTHNPNIVVNGDAELVLPFAVAAGETRLVHSGGMQEAAVRDEICRLMEGGREAFERRYRRIHGAVHG